MNATTITTMRFGVLTRQGEAEVHELPLPPVGAHQILIKQLACNICTYDYGQWLGKREHQGYPMAGGHEGAGVVIAKGDKVHTLELGDFVALANNYCGECVPCKEARESECMIRSSFDRCGENYKGRMGFADYCVRDAKSVVKMNPALSAAEAGFIEPLASVVRGLKKLRLRPFETVAVIGGGSMGMLNAQAVKAHSCRVLISEIMDNKIRTAKELGIETIHAGQTDLVEEVMRLTEGRGVDAVIMAVGSTAANLQAAKILKKCDGRILLFAATYPSPEIGLSANDIHYRRIELIGTVLANTVDFVEAADLLNTGAVNVRPLIENHYPLKEIQKAFEEAAVPGKYRVSIRLHEE